MALVIDEDVKARIQQLAAKHRRSTSGEIVIAIEHWLQQHASELDSIDSASDHD